MTPPDAHDSEDRHWSLESLNKAYQQGYMAGLTGQARSRQPYAAAIPAAAWEAGWDDGQQQARRAHKSA